MNENKITPDNPSDHLPAPGSTTMLEQFFRQDTIAAIFLLLCAVAAMTLANSSLGQWYRDLLHTKMGFVFGQFALNQTLLHWVNDGLMAVFFFMMGLEIKRELIVGELASPRKAMLPILAAIGGMIAPAAIFAVINYGSSTAHGWGIPMATDIAFATGCMAVLGKRIPPALKVFLMALAIVDDMGAVLVIAIFYSGTISLHALIGGLVLLATSAILNILGVRRTWPYVVIGIFVWLAFMKSGVHATIAGVLLAMTIPSRANYKTKYFADRLKQLNQQFRHEEDVAPSHPYMLSHKQQSLIRGMAQEFQMVEPPLQRMEHALWPAVMFVIMPIFALANAGVEINISKIGDALAATLTIGIIAGLVLGKQIGVIATTYLAVKLRLASLPKALSWRHIYGVACIAGIGFTMSMFINELAFAGNPNGSQANIDNGKIGIFIASIVSAIWGLIVLRLPRKTKQGDPA